MYRLAIITWLLFFSAQVVTTCLAQSFTDRAADDLLAQPTLQDIVDLQVARDGAGLIRYLRDPNPAVRARAAFALGSVQDSAAVPALLVLLGDDDARVRADAAFALGQMPGHVPPSALLQALTLEADTTVQRRLVEALGKKGDQASLVEMVSMEWGPVLRADVALAVGRYALRGIHAPEAVSFVSELLNAEDPRERLYAAYYFGRSRETEPWAFVSGSVRAALDSLRLDDAAAMHLVTALGRLEDRNDRDRLIHWLENAEDWRIQVNAARALHSLTHDPIVRDVLFDQLVHPSLHVAVAAAQTLSAADDWTERETTRIQELITRHPATWQLTSPLLAGVAREGDTAFVLGELERRRSRPLAYAHALPALGHLSPADAFDRLAEAVQSDDARVAYQALSALATQWQNVRRDPAWHRRYFDVFAGAVRRRDLATTYVAAPVLSDTLFLPFGSVDVLAGTYRQMSTPEDVEPMTAVLAALGATGDEGSEGVLREALSHSHPVIRETAARALHELTGERPAVSTETTPPERTIDWDYLQAYGAHPQLVFETAKGSFTILLDVEQAPLTSQTLIQFAEAGRYEGVPFHRVVPNFVIQGGDFARQDGFGGPAFTIRSEFTRIPFLRGTAGIASAGKDTEGSQYFITHSMQPHLDGRYTAFGVVVDGLDVVDQIYEDDRVLNVTVVPTSETGSE